MSALTTLHLLLTIAIVLAGSITVVMVLFIILRIIEIARSTQWRRNRREQHAPRRYQRILRRRW